MIYGEPRDHHCEGCPRRASAGDTNKKVCVWSDTEDMPERRKNVIRLVQRLMHNNPHPWCGFDRKFRLLIVKSALQGSKMLETELDKANDVEKRRKYRTIKLSKKEDFIPTAACKVEE